MKAPLIKSNTPHIPSGYRELRQNEIIKITDFVIQKYVVNNNPSFLQELKKWFSPSMTLHSFYRDVSHVYAIRKIQG